MKRLVTYLILFLIPIALLFSFPLFILGASGEFDSIEKVFIQQQKSSAPVLAGYAYSDHWGYGKLKATLNRAPKVLVLGTSRAMQFRSYFFSKSFYNAGGGVRTIKHFLEFLSQIPKGNEPELLIIGLDQNFFNADWDWPFYGIYQAPSPITARLKVFVNLWHKVYFDYFKKKIDLRKIVKPDPEIKKIGLNAIMKNDGYRNDGSYQWFDRSASEKYQAAFAEIAHSKGVFVHGKEVSPEAVEALEVFLNECRRRNIFVVGYLPPFAPLVYQKMTSKKAAYSYLEKLPKALIPLFEETQFDFYDFTHPKTLGFGDEEYIDGLHASERVYRKLFLLIVQNNPQLQSFADSSLYEEKI